jgi:multidrug efflux pump subunit AcrA (membrane-fusion protein)
MIELEVDNADGALMAGGYTDVHIKLPTSNQAVMLPVNTLVFRDGMQAAVVINDHVSLKHVTIGRDYGKTVEIVDGISPGDTVVINPMDSIEDGQEVRILKPKNPGQDSGKPDQASSK